MCGRFTLRNIKEVKSEFNLNFDLPPNFNIAPSNETLVLSDELTLMQWGYSPTWSKSKASIINARIETIKTKPSFKNLVKKNRCIVIANGYYEWITTAEGKQPVYIHSKENVILMAGLWTSWGNVSSFTIITKSSEGILKNIHHRMPLLINHSDVNTYLDNKIDFSDFHKFYNAGFKYHKVSKKVNYPKNNDASCIKTIG